MFASMKTSKEITITESMKKVNRRINDAIQQYKQNNNANFNKEEGKKKKKKEKNFLYR